jgi:hypothetical protein
MKHVLKKSCLLWLSLLSVLSIIWFIGMTNLATWESTTINTNPSDLHEGSLFSLYLSGASDYDSWLNVNSVWQEFLSILNWLIVWKNHNANADGLQFVFIGWWSQSTVSANNAWILWWKQNKVSSENWAIGWWMQNKVEWEGWVVAWGYDNKVVEWGVVVWWSNNNFGNKWVVLWWKNNEAWTNSLVLWQNANWGNNSFAWNQTTNDDTAGISSNNWVLIWTVTAKPWVSLVVNWAVKLWKEKDPDIQWEINSKEWCIKIYDGTSNHVLGKSSDSEDQCGAKKWCQFGKTMLQNGEIIQKSGTGPRQVKAYKSPYSTNCENERVQARCDDWNLRNITSPSSKVYPYCYVISSNLDPRNTVIN